ncbi:hypothetical protein, partial [Archangium sp.]|uniref:hypothetical protein n=1 Tax=Archangium sp. TaxID=1872627 RepID=UPI002EDAD2F2
GRDVKYTLGFLAAGTPVGAARDLADRVEFRTGGAGALGQGGSRGGATRAGDNGPGDGAGEDAPPG